MAPSFALPQRPHTSPGQLIVYLGDDDLHICLPHRPPSLPRQGLCLSPVWEYSGWHTDRAQYTSQELEGVRTPLSVSLTCWARCQAFIQRRRSVPFMLGASTGNARMNTLRPSLQEAMSSRGGGIDAHVLRASFEEYFLSTCYMPGPMLHAMHQLSHVTEGGGCCSHHRYCSGGSEKWSGSPEVTQPALT